MTEHRDVSLSRLAGECWDRLLRAAANPSDPWHTMVVATVDATTPELRTVVLRACEPGARRLLFHTDVRSAKARELAANPSIAMLFWDPELRLQLRCTGRATLHPDDALNRTHWERLPDRSRELYRQIGAPGEPVTDADRHDPRPDAASDSGCDRFLVVSCVIDRMDRLELDADGHQRANWNWQDDGWRGARVTP